MGLWIELERAVTMTVREWEVFLHHARAAGAADDSRVAEVMSVQSDDIIDSYRIEVQGQRCPTEPDAEVRLPAWLARDLLNVAREVVNSDGDVRGLQASAGLVLQRSYGHLLGPVLGEDPYDRPPQDNSAKDA